MILTAAEGFCNDYQLYCTNILTNILVKSVILVINKVLELCSFGCFLTFKKAFKDNLAWHLKQRKKKKEYKGTTPFHNLTLSFFF